MGISNLYITIISIVLVVLSLRRVAASQADADAEEEVGASSAGAGGLLPPSGSEVRRRKLAMYESILFPNRSYFELPFGIPAELEGTTQQTIIPAASYAALAMGADSHGRKLRLDQPADFVADSVQCSNCQGLDKCSVLNGKLIEERYYASINLKYGTCVILESLGVRMDEEIFGKGRAFRDTPQCREIVMQYLCLFWGSQNSMYRNYCYWKEDVSNPDPTQHVIAPRPPCRSFCVQVSHLTIIYSSLSHSKLYVSLCNCRSLRCVPPSMTSWISARTSSVRRRRTSARPIPS